LIYLLDPKFHGVADKLINVFDTIPCFTNKTMQKDIKMWLKMAKGYGVLHSSDKRQRNFPLCGIEVPSNFVL
jgi:hypothetical protein